MHPLTKIDFCLFDRNQILDRERPGIYLDDNGSFEF